MVIICRWWGILPSFFVRESRREWDISTLYYNPVHCQYPEAGMSGELGNLAMSESEESQVWRPSGRPLLPGAGPGGLKESLRKVAIHSHLGTLFTIMSVLESFSLFSWLGKEGKRMMSTFRWACPVILPRESREPAQRGAERGQCGVRDPPLFPLLSPTRLFTKSD